MFLKFVLFMFLLATTLALDPHEVNSYVTYNDNHNSVQHIQSAPSILKVAAPAAPVYETQAAPIYASPVVAKLALPAVARYAAPASAYYRASAAPVYAAPTLVNYAAAPSAATYYNAAPSAATYYNTAPSAATYYNAAPSVYASAPVAKVATVAYAAPVANYAPTPSYSGHHQEEYAHPKYEYSYSVEDHHTGDLHSQQEQRDGDHVVGQYSLKEADGTIRIVKYYDDGHGFNAVVERQGTPTEAPVLLKKVVVPVAAPHY